MNRRMTPWGRLGVALLGLVLTSGCSDLGTPLKPQPHGAVSVSALDFGTVALSQSSTRTVTLTNIGTGDLVGAVTISCSEYSLDSGGGPYSLAAGESRTVTLRFTPSDVGSFPCELQFGSPISSIPIAALAALQNPGARCIVLQDSIPFGATRVGNSINKILEVLNAGVAPLLVNIVSSCGDYEVVSGGGAGQIPAGSSLNVIVSFHPSAGGRSACEIALGPECPNIAVSGAGFTLSFDTDVQPILTTNCGECHEFGMPQYYNTYETLVTWYSTYEYGRIKPYDLDRSYLYQRMIGNRDWGSRMPPGVILPDADIEVVRQWILEGAQDN